MIKTLFLVIIIFLVFNTEPLCPQENTDIIISDTITIINSIEVIGLRRTRLYIVMQELEQFLGMERAAFDQNEVFAVIINMGILEPVSAQLIENEDGIILRVIVEEKWTIFPLPLVFVSSGETTFGLFFLDTNAFGSRDIIALGGTYGSSGWSAITMYNYTPRRKGLPGWNTFFMYNRQETEAVDRNETIHSRYTADRLRVSLGLNYLLMDIITASFSLSFSDTSLKNTNDMFNSPESGASILGFGPGISLRQSSWDGFFLSQQSIMMEYNYHYAISGTSFHQLGYRGIYEHSLVPGFRLNIRSGGVWKSTSDQLFEEGPSQAQVLILPQNYSAQHYIGLSLGLERYLYRTRWGTFSIQGSWQGVFSHGSISSSEINQGPAGGLNVYLSRLALPAMGINIAYNIYTGLYQFSFNMGMSF